MASTKAPRRDSTISHRHSLSSMTTTATLPHPFVLSSTPDSKHLFALTALPAALVSAARRFRLRSSLLALFALLALTGFCVLHQHLNDVPSLSFPRTAPPSRHHPVSSSSRSRHRAPPSRPPRPKITLAPDEELAAVIAFFAALASNALPDSVDPLRPIDPDLVLDFDTRTTKAALEVRDLVQDTWARHPVVLLSKSHSPIVREINTILADLNLKPAPVAFEIDQRADTAVVTPLLYRLTAATDLPILLIAGQPVGSIETIRELHSSGQLRTAIAASGAVIDGTPKKKKGRRATSRR